MNEFICANLKWLTDKWAIIQFPEAIFNRFMFYKSNHHIAWLFAALQSQLVDNKGDCRGK